MPRKKQPKCIYCRSSKLTNECFEAVLICFLGGFSAEKSRTWMQTVKAKIGGHVPSEKTIRRHFHMIGNRVFDEIVEPWIRNNHAGAMALKNKSPSEYESALEKVLLLAHEAFLAGDVEQSQNLNDCMMAYRSLSANKYGVRSSIRENLALAVLRQWFMEAARKEVAPVVGMKAFNEISLMGFVELGSDYLKRMFRERPL